MLTDVADSATTTGMHQVRLLGSGICVPAVALSSVKYRHALLLRCVFHRDYYHVHEFSMRLASGM